MANVSLPCPQCNTPNAVPAADLGRPVACRDCGFSFPTELGATPDAAVAPLPVVRPVAKPVPVARRAEPDDDDRPRRTPRRRDDDEDDRPARRPRGNGLLLPALLGGGLFLAVLGGAGMVIFADRSDPPPPPEVAEAEAVPPAAVEPPQPQPAPPPPPPLQFNPPEPGPAPAPADDAVAKMFEVQRRIVEDERKRRVGEEERQRQVENRGPGDPNAGPPPAYAAVRPLPILPPPLPGNGVTVPLPGPATEVCAGGGGRFLFLFVPSAKQIAVFDANEAKVVKLLDLPPEAVKIAAGMNALVVTTDNFISRYALPSLKREAQMMLPVRGKVKALALGAASAGPLLVHHTGDGDADPAPITFLDPATLKPVAVKIEDFGHHPPQYAAGDLVHFRASPDGTVFTFWAAKPRPVAGRFVATPGRLGLRGASWTGIALPTDGGHVLSAQGVADPDGPFPPGLPPGALLPPGGLPREVPPRLRVPAAVGPLYLTVDGESVSVSRTGSSGLAVTLRVADFPTYAEPKAGDVPADRRVHFVPDAKIVAVLPPDRDRLVLHKFDPTELMDLIAAEVPVVAGRPPTATPGQKYAFPLAVRARPGEVTYRVDAAPPGLAVSPDGRVVWDVPADFVGPAVVRLAVTDSRGRTTLHSFRIVAGVGGPPAVAVPDLPPAVVPVQPPPVPTPPPPVVAKAPPPPAVVRPPAAVFALKPTLAADGTVVTLPESANAVCVGGGGRFLFFRLPKNRQLAVFDATHGRVIKYLPLAEDAALVAAGMAKLFILNPAANALQRWNLSTFERETTVANPLGGTPRQMLMGHATDGPLYVGGEGVTAKNYALLDPTTFREVDLPDDAKRGARGGPGVSRTHPPTVRVSADGRVYAWWTSSLSPSGVNSLVVGGSAAAAYNLHQSAGAVLPGPDGTLFTTLGAFTPELKPLGAVARAGRATNYPATAGPWYLAVTGGDRSTGTAAVTLDLRMLGDARPLFSLKNPKGLDGLNRNPGSHPADVPVYDRLHFIPEAELVVVLNAAGDRLHLHRVNLKDRLEAGGIDYLLVTSRPPAVATRGKTFEYKPAVLSKRGGVKLKVEAGPPGLTAAGDAVTWAVPETVDAGGHNVLLTVSDASGQEVFHAFTLTVRDQDAAAKPGRPNVLPEPPVPPPPVEVKKEPEPLPLVVKNEPQPPGPVRPVPPPLPPKKDPPAATVEPNVEPAPKPPVEKPAPAVAGPNGSRLIVPPAVHPVIRPTTAADRAVVRLPAAADHSCYAGAGRYILYRLPSLRQLAVFDAQSGTIAKTLPLVAGSDLIAGGASKIFALNPATKQLTVWNLATFEQERRAAPKLTFAPDQMAVGHGTDGPLAVASGRAGPKTPLAWIDGRTLQPVDMTYVAGHPGLSHQELAAAGTGKVFSWYSAGGLGWVELTAAGAELHRKAGVHAAPLFDGRIYTGGKYVFPAPEGSKPAAATPSKYAYTPAADGPFTLRVDPTPTTDKDGNAVHRVSAQANGSPLYFTTLDPVTLPPAAGRKPTAAGPAKESPFPVHLLAESGLWIHESPDRTQLTLRKLDLQAALANRPTEVVIVASRPPLAAARGRPFAYTPQVWGTPAAHAVTLVGGPPGMTVEAGTVTWAVPAAFEADVVPVKLQAEAGGQKMVQEFDLHPTGG